MPIQVGGNLVATMEDLQELEIILDRVSKQVEVAARPAVHGLAGDVHLLQMDLKALTAQVDRLQHSVNQLETGLGIIAKAVEHGERLLDRINGEFVRGIALLQQVNIRLNERKQAENKGWNDILDALARQMLQFKSYHMAILSALDEYQANIATLTQLEKDSVGKVELAMQVASEAVRQVGDLVSGEVMTIVNTFHDYMAQKECYVQQEQLAFERLFDAQEQMRMHMESIKQSSAELTQIGEALRDYQGNQITLMEKRYMQVLNNRAAALLQRGEYTAATSLLEEARTLNVQDPAICVNLGLAYMRQGQAARAEQMFQWALSLAPDMPEACNSLATLYLELLNFVKLMSHPSMLPRQL